MLELSPRSYRSGCLSLAGHMICLVSTLHPLQFLYATWSYPIGQIGAQQELGYCLNLLVSSPVPGLGDQLPRLARLDNGLQLRLLWR